MRNRAVTVAEVQRRVEAYYGLPDKALRKARRDRRAVWPRHLAMYLARRLTPCSLQALGNLFNRHHTAVLYGIRMTEQRLVGHAQFGRDARRLEADLTGEVEPAGEADLKGEGA